MSFTKGPWQQDKYGSVQDASGESIQFRGVSTLCSGSENRIAEAEANTRLIASAPELLDALEKAMAFIDCHLADPDLSAEMCAAHDALRACNPHAILAKARGES